MKEAIVVENLTKTYYLFDKDYKIFQWLFSKKGNIAVKKALDSVSLKVNRGEVVGIIGKNGTGKSTLMKLAAGITFPTSGRIKVNGSIGSLINLNAGFNPDYTGRQNIYYKGNLLGMTSKQVDNIMNDIINFVELDEYFDMPFRTYSSGMAARLGFALAVFSDPDILIIDEVFAVGDKNFQTKSKAKTIELFKSGKSILFTSHSDNLIQEFCHRVVYINNGKIVFDGDVNTGLSLYSEDVKKKK